MSKFLRQMLFLIVLLSIVVSACAPATTPPPPPMPTDAPEPTTAPDAATDTPAPPPSKFGESPMLAAKVTAGELPPIEERLPENPRVVEALGSAGQGVYSDELKLGFAGTDPGWGLLNFFACMESLVSWSPDFNKLEMSLAEKIDVSADAMTYTIHLRKGLKWSDGAPYTADDIMFYIDDVMMNKEFNPDGTPPQDWLPKPFNEGFKAKKIDETTVEFSFTKPYGTLLYKLTVFFGRQFTTYPKHYLMQYHKTYNDKVDELVTKEDDPNVTDWMALFYKKGPDNWGNPSKWWDHTGVPTMNPWIVTKPLGTGTQVELERNPYYWKVDAQGNQLPYFDKVLAISYADLQGRTLAMLNGDLDWIKDPPIGDRTLFYDAVDQGKPLSVKLMNSDGGTTATLHFNQTIADPVKAEVFGSKDFRIGMSHAINRQEVIDVVFAGQGTPRQPAPLPDSPLYIPGMDTQYTEYDVAKANEYLDKILPTKGADGFRQTKDGKPFKIIYSVQNDLTFGPFYVQLIELLIGYWKEVGVNVQLNSIPGTQHEEDKKQNLLEANIYTGEGGAGLTPILDPRYYVPFEGAGVWNHGWFGWYVPDATGATVAVEPPQWAKDARAKFEAVLQEPTAEGQIAKMKIVLEEAKERFYILGISLPAPMYSVFSARLGGIPDEPWYDGWNEGTVKILSPEQWFIKP